MNEKLKAFLDAKAEEERKSFEEKKQKNLIELGLYDKEYSPYNEYSEEYTEYEWDEKNQVSKYYKKIALDITDDEYRDVQKYLKEEESKKSNGVAIALLSIAITEYCLGFLAGFFLMEEAGLEVALIMWITAFVSGTLFLGFAEIIKLLHEINQK